MNTPPQRASWLAPSTSQLVTGLCAVFVASVCYVLFHAPEAPLSIRGAWTQALTSLHPALGEYLGDAASELPDIVTLCAAEEAPPVVGPATRAAAFQSLASICTCLRAAPPEELAEALLPLPLLLWSDVRMTAYRGFVEQGLRRAFFGDAPLSIPERAQGLTRPLEQYGVSAYNLTWSGGMLPTPVFALTTSFRVALNATRACQVIGMQDPVVAQSLATEAAAGAGGSAFGAFTPREADMSPDSVLRVWEPGYAVVELWRTSEDEAREQREASGAAASWFFSPSASSSAASPEETAPWDHNLSGATVRGEPSGVWEEVGRRAEALGAADGMDRDLESGAPPVFSWGHLDAAYKSMGRDLPRLLDVPGRMRRPGSNGASIPMLDEALYDLHNGNDLQAIVKAQFAAEGRKGGNASNAWMYVPGINVGSTLTLLTAVDALVGLRKPETLSVSTIRTGGGDSFDSQVSLSFIATYWHNFQPGGGRGTQSLAGVPRVDTVIPAWNAWPDNYWHTLVETNIRSVLLAPLLGQLRTPPLTDCPQKGEAESTGTAVMEELGFQGAHDMCMRAWGPKVLAGVAHVLDASFANFPDVVGMLALRERVRSLLGLPQAALGYLGAGEGGLPPLPRDACLTTPCLMEGAAVGAPSAAAQQAGCPAAYARRPQVLVLRRAKSRRVTNIDALISALNATGAAVTVLSDSAKPLPYREQWSLFAGADAIVSGHGAALSNTIACAPGSLLVEFIPAAWSGHFYMHQAVALGMEYHRYDVRGGKADDISAPVDAAVQELCGFFARTLAAAV